MLAADGPGRMGSDAERSIAMVTSSDPSRAFAAYLATVSREKTATPSRVPA